MKNVSNYIGTRNIGQVRSHLQKHLIKQKKLKEKSKKDNIKEENNKTEEIEEDKDNKGIKLNEDEEKK